MEGSLDDITSRFERCPLSWTSWSQLSGGAKRRKRCKITRLPISRGSGGLVAAARRVKAAPPDRGLLVTKAYPPVALTNVASASRRWLMPSVILRRRNPARG